jgi:hypothetical protein
VNNTIDESALLRSLDSAEDANPGNYLSVDEIENLAWCSGIGDPEHAMILEKIEAFLAKGWLETNNDGFEIVEQKFRISAKGQIRAAASVDYADQFRRAVNSLPDLPGDDEDKARAESVDSSSRIDKISNASDELITVQSSTWTGLTQTIIDSRNAKVVSGLICKALDSLSAAEIGNFETMQATAYLKAARELVDAPEPPSEEIWRLISRAADIAGLAAVFFAIFAQVLS